MSEFIQQVKSAWVTARQRDFNRRTRGIMTPEERRVVEGTFDEALAEHDRQVAAKAWDEAEREITKSIGCSFCHGDAPYPENPYRKEELVE